ncbi:hypothetical protein B447_17546 [Thauera sp. 27]|uniref:hypothetical protein n=1 Tax=Thauera sp. 27 TaxID=305700 RepID=UPI0002CFD196|nr:hypothetical protein [Thauera sp. 27]ENO76571.1 hypothetical protein B447_17546 [Thauera sp. 27]
MVARLSVKSDIDQVIGRVARAAPHAVEIATQRALLHTAREVKNAEVREMGRVFDRPTRWTLNSFQVRLDKAALQARVEIKDGYWYRADNYLQTQIEGGSRKSKAFETALRRVGVLPAGWFIVPGEKASLDAFGNISVGQIRQILSWFDAAEMVAGSMQNMGERGREKRRRGTRTRRGFEYFVAQPGSRVGRGSWKNGRPQNLQPGVYRRTAFGFGSAIEPILIFVTRANYKPRFDFYGVAQRTVDREFKPRLDAALQFELDRLSGAAGPSR